MQLALADDPRLQIGDRLAQRAFPAQRIFQRTDVRRLVATEQRLQAPIDLGHDEPVKARQPAEQRPGHKRHVARHDHDGALAAEAQRGYEPAQRMSRQVGLAQHRAADLRQRRVSLGDDHSVEPGFVKSRERVAHQMPAAELLQRLRATDPFAPPAGEHHAERATSWRVAGSADHISQSATDQHIVRVAFAGDEHEQSTSMIEVEQARRLVLERTYPLPCETVQLRAARGRVLAEDLVSSEDVPGFDGSAMDGFAVRASDTRGAGDDSPVTLRLVGESRAGHPAACNLQAGQAIAISTGGELPTGADAVIRVEHTRPQGGSVAALREVKAGCDVRYAGEDVRAGDTVLEGGVRLGPAELGVLASLGRPAVQCVRQPSVQVLVTGDELIEPDATRPHTAVRNSNGYALGALVEQAGAQLAGVALVADDLDDTRSAIATALAADVTVICGGVSVGAHDHVKQALLDLEVEQVFWRVALKPGKPTWFGRHPGGLVFGLPGNPVSAMVTFILFVRPALLALSGSHAPTRRTTATLMHAYSKTPDRAHAVPCRLELDEHGWRAHPAGQHGSHILTAMLAADALAILPKASNDVPAGACVEIELFGDASQ